MAALAGKVAVVTGASRGVGKGIALALAEQGATVYVTGRTVVEGSAPLPGTVGQTASECDARGQANGGKGIAVPVDLASDTEIAALFERIEREQGRLDILVNNAIMLPDHLTGPDPFWQRPLSDWGMVDIGLRAAFVCAWHAAKLMAAQGSGLIVGISGFVGVTYTYGTVFGTTKAALDRMARDMAIELQPHGVASVSLWQGFTYTERAMENLRNVPGLGEQLKAAAGSSPEFPGRVIAALASDPALMDKSGGTFIMAELAQEYGVTDVDGSAVPSNRASRGSPIWKPVSQMGDA